MLSGFENAGIVRTRPLPNALLVHGTRCAHTRMAAQMSVRETRGACASQRVQEKSNR